MLADLGIKEFVDQTASSKPVPGGGSAAALSGALAAGLTEMVAGLTIGRKGFEAVESDMQRIAEEAGELRKKCLQNIDRDSDAYTGVIDAFRLPKSSPEEKNTRKLAIQTALQHASRVPLETAELAARVIELAGQVVAKGNPNAVTDGAVAGMLARTAVLAGAMNVRINLATIEDRDFTARLAGQVDELEARAKKVEQELLAGLKL
ncbi:MAG: methenyltetrahydrofolate cyclohydrolase [Deltaproteobacteria bacterium SG8_13]|nr:MAG: methenyltetrahydrofolate cyclohydrolase [Deltaproteobacteria bacterium SG8_13]